MGADIYIFGTLKKSGDVMRINAQLIKAEKSEPYKSFQVEGPPGSILHITDSLSSLVRETLMITRFENRVPEGYRHLVSATSPDAMRYFTHGHNAFFKKDYSTALRYLSQSASSDSGFALSMIMLDLTYISMGDYARSKSLSSRILSRMNNMSIQNRMLSQWLFSVNNETPYEELKYLRLLQETEPPLPLLRLAIGHSYLKVMQYGDAASELEKELEEQEKMDPGLILPQNYTMLGTAWHMTRQFGKEEKIYTKAEKAFPADADLRYRQAVLALTKNDTAAAEEYVKKYRYCLSAQIWPEKRIISGIAHIFSEAGYREKAESFFRMALSSSNGDPEAINELASFLVDNGKAAEGLDLIEPVLKKDSLNYNYLYTKGRGLFRQSKYAEAFGILSQSWNLRHKYSLYDHEAFLYLDSVKKKAEGLETVF
jgi:tetratricopeptide (TPR) repeat protein